MLKKNNVASNKNDGVELYTCVANFKVICQQAASIIATIANVKAFLVTTCRCGLYKNRMIAHVASPIPIPLFKVTSSYKKRIATPEEKIKLNRNMA